jgi:hypothetical protein
VDLWAWHARLRLSVLWLVLCTAPDEGVGTAGLMRLSGMTLPTLYWHLARHVLAGRVVPVSHGRWRKQPQTHRRDGEGLSSLWSEILS